MPWYLNIVIIIMPCYYYCLPSFVFPGRTRKSSVHQRCASTDSILLRHPANDCNAVFDVVLVDLEHPLVKQISLVF